MTTRGEKNIFFGGMNAFEGRVAWSALDFTLIGKNHQNMK